MKIRPTMGRVMVAVGMLEVRIMLRKVMTYAVVGLIGVADKVSGNTTRRMTDSRPYRGGVKCAWRD